MHVTLVLPTIDLILELCCILKRRVLLVTALFRKENIGAFPCILTRSEACYVLLS